MGPLLVSSSNLVYPDMIGYYKSATDKTGRSGIPRRRKRASFRRLKLFLNEVNDKLEEKVGFYQYIQFSSEIQYGLNRGDGRELNSHNRTK